MILVTGLGMRSRVFREVCIQTGRGIAFLLLAPAAFAQVIEPNGISVPVTNSETSLQEYFDGVGEGIDAVADAAAEPGTFSPLCDFDATLVLSQSQAQAAIGWYNVPASDTAAIPMADVHIVVPIGTPLNTVISADD